jgi:hypothetical protein
MQWAEKVKQLQNLTKPLNQNRMKVQELINLLNGAKALSSQVDIDKMIDLLNGLEGTSSGNGISEAALEDFINSVSNTVDGFCSEDVVQYDSAEFDIDRCNTVSLTHVDIDLSTFADTIRELMLEQFEIEED